MNIYADFIFREALEDKSEDIKIGGENINNIRYADDTVILAESDKDLRTLLLAVETTCEEYGISINVKKTKVMVITPKTEITAPKIVLQNGELEVVEQYKYLGAWINRKGDSEEEIMCRIGQAKSAFAKMKKTLTSHQ